MPTNFLHSVLEYCIHFEQNSYDLPIFFHFRWLYPIFELTYPYLQMPTSFFHSVLECCIYHSYVHLVIPRHRMPCPK
eukprot:14561_5